MSLNDTSFCLQDQQNTAFNACIELDRKKQSDQSPHGCAAQGAGTQLWF